MFKIIKISGKDYKLEYSIEASLYSDCTVSVTSLYEALANNDGDIMKVIAGISNIPVTALTLFYAGLLEHHGTEGDGTVLNIKDAKLLAVQYMKELREEGKKGNWYDLFSICAEQLNEDNFFDLIGLADLMEVEE